MKSEVSLKIKKNCVKGYTWTNLNSQYKENSNDKVLMFLKILTEMGRAMDICTTEGWRTEQCRSGRTPGSGLVINIVVLPGSWGI